MFWNLLKAFVPVFIAVDAIGILPMFLSLTEGMDASQRRGVIWQSMVTAFGVALAFILLGKSVFGLMNISQYDFMVAGGLLLFLIASMDLLVGYKLARGEGTVGAVPIGTPLIVGPAVLTTVLMMVDAVGYAATLVSVVLNIIIAGGILMSGPRIVGLLGQTGSRAVTKVASLLLAAIAVMMIRRGILGLVGLAAEGRIGA